MNSHVVTLHTINTNKWTQYIFYLLSMCIPYSILIATSEALHKICRTAVSQTTFQGYWWKLICKVSMISQATAVLDKRHENVKITNWYCLSFLTSTCPEEKHCKLHTISHDGLKTVLYCAYMVFSIIRFHCSLWQHSGQYEQHLIHLTGYLLLFCISSLKPYMQDHKQYSMVNSLRQMLSLFCIQNH